MNDLRITSIQTDIIWENKEANLNKQQITLQKLKGTTDLVVFPEMFTTGFSMDSPNLAEPENGETISRLKYYAEIYELALTGSFICSRNGKFYNRGFFIKPDNEISFYDKRHLFRMGKENQSFSAGQQQTIISYKDWNICLSICYDLRFPIWLRNNNTRYDLLIVSACWPQPRISVWDILLRARAIENQAYICGVNRIGYDPSGRYYPGHSAVIDPKGEIIQSTPEGKETCITTTLSAEKLTTFRQKFPVLQDADSFSIHI
ncbi:nitrilase family protein [Coprobacter sp.]|uniref:nitrilase family protein n=1 Tax=Coprobacter sp. TaxID=1941478 RepID=UPI003AB5132B